MQPLLRHRRNAKPGIVLTKAKIDPKAGNCQDFHKRIVNADGTCNDFRCKKCNTVIFFRNWARQCNQHHKDHQQKSGDDDPKKNDDDDDDEEEEQRAVKGGKEVAEPKKR